MSETEQLPKFVDCGCLLRGELDPITDTPHHDALQVLTDWRANDLASDTICENFTMLTGSPAFKAFLVGAMEPSHRDLNDPEWNLAFFAAEMFTAGVLAARREAGIRKPVLEDAALEGAVAANRYYATMSEIHEGRR